MLWRRAQRGEIVWRGAWRGRILRRRARRGRMLRRGEAQSHGTPQKTQEGVNESVATCVSWRSEVPHFTPRWPHILAKPPATPRTVYTALQITGIFHNSSKSWVQYKNPEGQSQCKKKISSEKHFQWKVKRKLITAHQAEAHHSQSKEIPLKPDTPPQEFVEQHLDPPPHLFCIIPHRIFHQSITTG